MSNVTINLRLRPLRFAFLIRPNDYKHSLQAFHINTCLWGGHFNPIIPFFKQLPIWWDKKGHRFESAKQILNGYLDFFEPDFIVEAERGLARGLNFNQERILKITDLIPDGDREIKGYGLSANALYGDLYKKEFQFSMRHRPNIIHVKSNDSSFDTFVACVFGAFPTQKKNAIF